jgi:hypothetical protein
VHARGCEKCSTTPRAARGTGLGVEGKGRAGDKALSGTPEIRRRYDGPLFILSIAVDP